jgi:hypothetical protein
VSCIKRPGCGRTLRCAECQVRSDDPLVGTLLLSLVATLASSRFAISATTVGTRSPLARMASSSILTLATRSIEKLSACRVVRR